MSPVEGPSPVEGRFLSVLVERPVMPRVLPVGWLSKAQAASELQALQRRRAADAAYEAELVLRMADLSPDDPDPAGPGAATGGWAPDGEFPGVSEFFPAELGVVLNCGRGTPAYRLRRAWTWRVPLPPPAENLRPRLALRHGRRRHPARHHPLRRHPHHPTTRHAPPTGARTRRNQRRHTHAAGRGAPSILTVPAQPPPDR